MANPGRLLNWLQEGLASARPSTPDISANGLAFYYATDTSTLSYWTGSAWANVSGGGSGVSSLNSLTGALSITAGANVTVTPSGSSIQISASSASAAVFNVKTGYSAKLDGKQITGNTSITSGANALTVTGAAFVAGDVGKSIMVPGAGASGAPLVTTIASYVSATQVTLTANASTTLSAVSTLVTYGTDDTTAFQNAINAAYAAGGGVVYVPPGIAIIAGALQDTGRGNAQLIYPAINTAGPVQTTIAIVGDLPAPTGYGLSIATPLPTYGAVIVSLLASGNGALLGGWGPSGSGGNLTYVNAVLKNLTFRMAANPTNSCVDLSHCTGCDIDNITCDTSAFYMAGITQPTTTTSFGLRTPGNNNAASSLIRTACVIGFYNGIEISEHVTAVMLNVAGCINATTFTFAYHPSSIQRILATWCKNVLVGPTSAGSHYTQIEELAIEHATGGWYATTYDVLDASNYLIGAAKWHAVLASSGVTHTFSVSGAVNLLTSEIGNSAQQRLAYNPQSGTTYTLAMSDINGMVTMTNAGACTLTLPQDSAVNIPIGCIGYFAQGGAGVVTAVAGTGATVNAPNGAATAATNDARGWEKMAANTFRIW